MASTRTSLETAIHEKIRSAGLRLTMPRRAICSVLSAHEEEFLTTSEILSAVEAAGSAIDPSTVYRTLDDFAEIGLVHHVHLGSQPGQWHLTVDHDHQHLVCEICGKTTLVPTSEVQPLFEQLRTAYGFHASLHHFAILGHCDDCEPSIGHPHI
jgi:Fe2+ or Zn2+ uptake regulation protein